MKIKTSLSITRATSREGDKISIELQCESSRTHFFKMDLTPEDFALAITGLYLSGQDATVAGLANVGKERVRETRSIICPLTTYKTNELEDWLRENGKEEGWIVDSYLGSQKSKESLPGNAGQRLNYAVHKFVEVNDATTS